jgi:peptide/nickel transport system substrate-binding protein
VARPLDVSHDANSKTLRILASLILASLILSACAGDRGRHGGVLVISTAGDADVLFPPTARQLQAVQVLDLVFDRLADIGPDRLTFGDAQWTPRLAQSWNWSADSMAVTFHLDPRARWHDSVPVRARDVRFAYEVYTDPAVAAGGTEVANTVDSVSLGDSLTATVWFRTRSPERFFSFVNAVVPLPEHLLGGIARDSLRSAPFTRAPVGNGPYRFVRWEPRQTLEVAAVPDYYRSRPYIDRVIWTIAPDGPTAVQRVINGEADFIETLTPSDVSELSRHQELRAVPIQSNAYVFLVFNAHDGASDRPHPLLANRELRRALTMAVDRQAIVRNLLDTLGAVLHGPFPHALWSADTTLHNLQFSRTHAAQTLDSLGWVRGKDGIRVRGGMRLAFSLLVPTSSPIRQRLAVLLQEQWRQVGVDLDVERVEVATMNERMNAKRFDSFIFQLAASPSPASIRQIWSTSAIAMANGLNMGRYSNAVVDSLIARAVDAPSVSDARARYREVYQALLDDAPGIWLYEPIVFGAANTRIALDGFRAAGWWTTIPMWRASGAGPRDSSAVRR